MRRATPREHLCGPFPGGPLRGGPLPGGCKQKVELTRRALEDSVSDSRAAANAWLSALSCGMGQAEQGQDRVVREC